MLLPSFRSWPDRTAWSIGLALLAAVPSEAASSAEPPPITVRLVAVTRFFWVDAAESPGAAGARARLRGTPVDVEVLADESLGGWRDAQGRALVAVPEAGTPVEHIAVVSLHRDESGDRAIRLERALGVRFPTPDGRFNLLFAPSLQELPEFARLEIERRMRLLKLERKLYRETYYRVSGMTRHRIRMVTASGPDLVVLPRAWRRILEGDRAATSGPLSRLGGEPCLSLGPVQMCLNGRDLIDRARAARRPRGRSRIPVRRLWPEPDGAYGLLVWSRPSLAESPVVFHVDARRRRDRASSRRLFAGVDVRGPNVPALAKPEPP